MRGVGADPDAPEWRFSWDDLPAATAGVGGTGGSLRASPDDFEVDEIPSYLPSGEGAHAYARIEKRDMTTMDVVAALERCGVPRGATGFAGQKDKRAVARQWLSVPAECAAAFKALDDVDGVSVLETSLHRNKLGLGHLRGNRFKVRARGAMPDWLPVAEQVLARLRRVGLPNYFGPQRFGSFNTNAADGLRLLAGERLPGGRRLHRFYMSALQAHIFNRMLKLRIEDGLYDAVVSGDTAQRHDSGGMFVVEDAAAETERARRLEISAALPLCGKKARPSPGDAGALEARVMADLGLEREHFRSVRGARRISRALVEDAALRPADDGYVAEFTLPKGAYATSLMRELMKSGV